MRPKQNATLGKFDKNARFRGVHSWIGANN